jgi:hypothetical protein
MRRKKMGLKSVIGIPLIYNDEAIGVLKIGTKKSANYLNNYIRIFQRLEVFIGSELNRKKEKILVIYLMQFRYHLRFRFSRRFLKINKSGCDLIGFSEENILYHNFDEFVHPDDKEIFNDQVTDLEKRKVHSNLKIAMLRVMVILFGLVGIVTQP